MTRKGKIAFPRYAPSGHGRGDHFMMTIGVGAGVPIADLKAFSRLTARRLAAAKL